MNSIACCNKRNAASPWTGLQELENQLERALHGTPDRPASGGWAPSVDIYETADAYVLHADLPGVTKEEIEVQVVENQIAIRGTRKLGRTVEDKGFRRFKRAEGRFERSFRVREGIDASKVEAKFENGVLTVTLPKPEEAKPRQIEVKVN